MSHSVLKPAEDRVSPSRITLARLRRGMSKLNFADALGVTSRAVSNYENEGAPVSRLADIARILEYPEGFFLRAGASDLLDSQQVFFRARRRTSAYQRAAAVAVGEIGVELYEWVVDRFRLPDLDIVELDFEDPVRAAAALRAMWGLGIDPLPNLIQVAEAHGVRVLSLPVDTQDVDAFSFWRAGAPYILLSMGKTPERSRFDLAHELGHLVLHSHDSTGDSGPDRDLERDADRFASAFLMPPEALQAVVGREPAAPEILRVRSYFKVSAMAANRAAYDVGKMSDWTYRQNCIRLSQLGYRSGEPGGIQRERSRVFRMVLDLLRAQGSGASAMVEDLAISAQEVHGLTFGLAVASFGSPEPPRGPSKDRAALRLVGE